MRSCRRLTPTSKKRCVCCCESSPAPPERRLIRLGGCAQTREDYLEVALPAHRRRPILAGGCGAAEPAHHARDVVDGEVSAHRAGGLGALDQLAGQLIQARLLSGG